MKERLKKLEQVRCSQDYDKAKYMEGAVWLGRRVANEIEKTCQTVDGIIIEYKQRTEGIKFE